MEPFITIASREEKRPGAEVPRPQTSIVETTDTYGKFVMEPLERGFGTTLGNSLRRVLLGSIPGAAITWVRIEGVLHEYSSIPHVKEDVTELLQNFKGIRMRALSDRPGRMHLEATGLGMVCAGDITPSADFEIVNPGLYLASLDSSEGKLAVEFNVEQGKGYIPAQTSDGLPIGTLPVDAIYGPVRKANYTVEQTRVGQMTDYERLVLEVWTDGSIGPTVAVQRAAQQVVDLLLPFTTLGKVPEGVGTRPSPALAIPPEIYNTPVERLELSSRTLNCLKRANINKVGEILEKSRAELMKIRNFGDKSMEELLNRLREKEFPIPETPVPPSPVVAAEAQEPAKEE